MCDNNGIQINTNIFLNVVDKIRKVCYNINTK